MTTDRQRPVRAHPEEARLAAFAEGRLEGSARLQIVGHLAECADCADLVALALYESEATAGADPADTALPSPLSSRAWWAAAAVFAGAAVGIWVLRSPPAVPQEETEAVDRLVAALAADAGTGELTGVGWSGDGWSATRGPGQGTGRGESFRLGVGLVDLRLALLAEDAEGALGSLTSLKATLRDVEGGEVQLAFLYELDDDLQAATELAPLAARVSAAEVLFSSAVAEPFLAFGKWAEAGRIASRLGRLQLLEDAEYSAFPSRLEGALLPAEIGAGLEAVTRGLAEAGGGELEGAFRAIVIAGGNL